MAPLTAEEALAQIGAEVQACTRCALYRSAKLGVPGSGSAQAEVLLVGEAPSAYDDHSGRPFSGPSGAFLDELLALVGLDRAQIYLTNVVKHRAPPTRSPEPDELAACSGYLTRQIAAINPLVVVTLGRFALAHFFPRAKISQSHGQVLLARGRVVAAMYNPAAAARQEGLREVIVADFRRALPEALAEARRRLAAGERPTDTGDEPPAQQLSLF